MMIMMMMTIRSISSAPFICDIYIQRRKVIEYGIYVIIFMSFVWGITISKR